MSNWIPVGERLPEEDITVLITDNFANNSPSVHFGYIEGGFWRGVGFGWDGCSEPTNTVTAWQPLPEAYDPTAPTEPSTIREVPVDVLEKWCQNLEAFPSLPGGNIATVTEAIQSYINK